VEQVRVAGDDDLDRLVELAADFHSSAVGRRGVGNTRTSDDGGHPPEASPVEVGLYLSDPGRVALVGLLDNWIAGMALGRVDETDGDRRGVLDVCFVEHGAREVGLGRLLLDRSLEWFRSERCTGVDGTAFPGDREAKQFFESAGFKARLLVMYLTLD
jgi:GNAT superfamily N-acetyltransferase